VSRYNSSGATDFGYRRLGCGDYEISWVIDFYYPDSRLRFPRTIRRITDVKGAKRFCKKHNLVFKEV